MNDALRLLADALDAAPRVRRAGRLSSVGGTSAMAAGLGRAPLGGRVEVIHGDGALPAEIVGSRGGVAELAPFGEIAGLAPGARVLMAETPALRPSLGWLGRVVDPLGRPLDGRGPLPPGVNAAPLRRPAPPAAARGPLGPTLTTGIHAIDIFTPLRRGQRMGLFAGSGVGKSVLMAMIAARAEADAVVIGLVGERGREVNALLQSLPEAARARTALVVATSDQPAALRREAAYAATAVAEGLAAGGAHVLLMIDSVTRLAMAAREIGLAAGEPPAARGYTPGVFAELPRLLERAGPGAGGSGPITAIHTVLVDGGDHDEPVADAVRGILDGHVVLSRALAERGRLPAIDVLRSVSRSLPDAHTPARLALMREARALLADAADVEEVVRLGAYEAGGNARTDRALALLPALEALLTQAPDAASDPDPFARLAAILGDAA